MPRSNLHKLAFVSFISGQFKMRVIVIIEMDLGASIYEKSHLLQWL